ncbi:hypothetical protein KUCAC02_008798 [Chaenocephalus aceratus]|uniref:Uncharacterized protein n=1 Tax=Chaenocephalus aceratus TaxID=36190 RepID=A0ACB9WT45_CHAAC|nr:hypothetical protein KUCAC02_008798 [Chaenocephalus aceratus]
MEDSAVTDFVDKVRTNVKCTPGKGTCGTSQWSAARETARRASRLDEEGLYGVGEIWRVLVRRPGKKWRW